LPETPEELYERARDVLRTPPVEEWETWPFEGAVQPRALQPPEERERPRFGEGGEHLHWWFMARPARLPQLIGSFAAIWDDILPPAPEEQWRADLQALAAALG
jgi:hypothetical protein